MKIVVVSPNSTVANAVKNIFTGAKAQGVEVVATHTAESALVAITDKSLVLIDWEYPDERVPVQIVASIKSKMPQIVILLLCVKQKAGGTFLAMKAGASGVVNKPLDPGDLLRTVTAALKSKSDEKRPSVNVEFINPFIDSARNVMQTMCGVEVARKKLYLKPDYRMLGEISGVMALSGSATGSIVVSMSNKQACTYVGKMLGQDSFTEVNGDVKDGVGEIVNMIAGQAKSMLTKTKFHFQISIPTVVAEANKEIAHQKGSPNIVVLFGVPGIDDDFAMQVCLAATGNPDS